MDETLNVLGERIETCSCEPMTGWYRDGKCQTDQNDNGVHTICAEVNSEFLAFLKSRGNDLITASPQNSFPGLKPGDHWCVCAGSWFDAYKHGRACPINLAATNAETLAIIPISVLKENAL